MVISRMTWWAISARASAIAPAAAVVGTIGAGSAHDGDPSGAGVGLVGVVSTEVSVELDP